MGKAVVYCSGCGRRFQEEASPGGDPFCRDCRPAPARPASKTFPPSSPTPRRARPALAPAGTSRAPLYVGAGLGLFALAALVPLTTSKRPDPAPPPPAPVVHAPSPAPVRPPPPVPPSPEPRLPADLEREMRTAQEREQAAKFDAYLKQIDGLVRSEAGLARRSEVGAMLDSARGAAGARRAEVDLLAEEFAKRCAEADRAAAPPPVVVEPEAALVLGPDAARLRGAKIAVKERDGYRYIGNWNDLSDTAEWTARPPRAGRYRIVLQYAATKSGGAVSATFGAERLEATLAPTGDFKRYTTVTLGTLALPDAEVKVVLRGLKVPAEGLMNLRSLRFVPD